MAVKMKFEEFISDMKSITQMPMFTLSPAKKIEREDGDVKKDEKVKTKILEAWNNIRYDLGPVASLKKDIPIWILGVCHHSRSTVDELASVEAEEDSVFDSPLDRRIYTDFASRPRFTYRKNFPPISGTDITTDTGWGCMLRSAQMMIAQGLLFHFLGRDWRWLMDFKTRHEKSLHKEIIGWFVDDPSCPLSIHRLSEIGRKFGNAPGNWYGPNTAAHIMQNAVNEAKDKYPKMSEVAVYVAVDCTVYSEDVYNLCEWTTSSNCRKSPNKASERITTPPLTGTKAVPQGDFEVFKTMSDNTLSKDSIAEHETVIPPSDINFNANFATGKAAIESREVTSSKSISSETNFLDSSMCDSDTVIIENSHSTVEGPADEILHHSESWCEVPEFLPSTSYEDFTKFSEKKRKPKKSRFTMSKTKNEKISLYSEDGGIGSSELNGKIIMPHFPIVKKQTFVKQAHSAKTDPVRESIEMMARSSKTSRKSRKGIRERLKSDNAVKLGTEKPIVVTPETPSPILFRRTNSRTHFSDTDVLSSPDVVTSRISFFSSNEPARTDLGDDTFLSSYLEPVVPDDRNMNASMPGKHKSQNHCKLGQRTVVEEQNVNQKHSIVPLSFQSCQNDEKSHHHINLASNPVDPHECDQHERCNKTFTPGNGNRSFTSTHSVIPGNLLQSHPAIDSSITRDKPRLYRRSSSTSDVRPRSSTSGDPRHSSRGSLKFEGKRSNPTFETGRHKAVLILIPVRLGESSLNPIYGPCVEAMLSLGSSIGIIGGKPKHSLYFVGCQGQSLLHLDPHYCQPADTVTGYTKNLHDYHTTQIRKVNVKKIDPSCCLGFYCRNPEEFEEFKVQSQKNFTPPQQSSSYPMCLIMDGKAGDHRLSTPVVSPTVVPDTHDLDLTKNLSLPFASYDIGHDIGDKSPVSRKNSSSAERRDSNAAKSQKKKSDLFNMDDVSSTLNKFNPLAKLMRNRSPNAKRKSPVVQEELESQFELL